MDTARVQHRREAAQAIAGNVRAWRKMCLGPTAQRLLREACQAVQFDVGRAALAVQRDGGDEWRLVLGASPGLAAWMFAPEVGIVDLHGARELVAGLARGRGG